MNSFKKNIEEHLLKSYGAKPEGGIDKYISGVIESINLSNIKRNKTFSLVGDEKKQGEILRLVKDPINYSVITEIVAEKIMSEKKSKCSKFKVVYEVPEIINFSGIEVNFANNIVQYGDSQFSFDNIIGAIFLIHIIEENYEAKSDKKISVSVLYEFINCVKVPITINDMVVERYNGKNINTSELSKHDRILAEMMSDGIKSGIQGIHFDNGGWFAENGFVEVGILQFYKWNIIEINNAYNYLTFLSDTVVGDVDDAFVFGEFLGYNFPLRYSLVRFSDKDWITVNELNNSTWYEENKFTKYWYDRTYNKKLDVGEIIIEENKVEILRDEILLNEIDISCENGDENLFDVSMWFNDINDYKKVLILYLIKELYSPTITVSKYKDGKKIKLAVKYEIN